MVWSNCSFDRQTKAKSTDYSIYLRYIFPHNLGKSFGINLLRSLANFVKYKDAVYIASYDGPLRYHMKYKI